MTSTLPIAILIKQRCQTLGISRSDLVTRLGYRNITKGLRNVQNVCNGKLVRYPALIRSLPNALNVSDRAVDTAINNTKAVLKAAAKNKQEHENALYRANFQPHAVILTERSRPSPIFVVALLGADTLLRINVDLSQPRETWLPQAVAAVPAHVVGFGKPVAVVMNYSPNEAVQFDLVTKVTTHLDSAKRTGRANLSIRGKKLV